MGLCCGDTSAVLSDLVDVKQNLGLAVRLYFQKKYNSGVRNSFTVATADPTLQASWDALTAAVDDTKVVLAPKMENATFPEPEALLYESQNDGGYSQKMGNNPVTVQFELSSKDAATINAINALECNDLQVYVVYECGVLLGETLDDYTTFQGFTVGMLNIPPSAGGNDRENPQKVTCTMQLAPDWFANSKAIEPSDFNAKELQPA